MATDPYMGEHSAYDIPSSRYSDSRVRPRTADFLLPSISFRELKHRQALRALPNRPGLACCLVSVIRGMVRDTSMA